MHLPAEWHEQSGVQLTWPHANTDWAPILPDIIKVFVEMTRAITKREKVLIVAPNTDEVKAILMRNLGMERLRNVLFHQCDTNDTWARDHAALTLRATTPTMALGCKTLCLTLSLMVGAKNLQPTKIMPSPSTYIMMVCSTEHLKATKILCLRRCHRERRTGHGVYHFAMPVSKTPQPAHD